MPGVPGPVRVPALEERVTALDGLVGHVGEPRGLAGEHLLADKTVDGLEANVERSRALAETSPSIVTPLNKYIGYEAAAKIAKHSVAKGITVREATIELGYVDGDKLTMEQLDKALDVLSMTHPGL